MVTRWNGFLNTLRVKEWGGLEMPQSNYFWGYSRNELLWGIATYGENPMATTFLDYALNQRWTNSFVAHAEHGRRRRPRTRGKQLRRGVV